MNKITTGMNKAAVWHEQDQVGVNTAVTERRPRLNKIHDWRLALNTTRRNRLPAPGATPRWPLVFTG